MIGKHLDRKSAEMRERWTEKRNKERFANLDKNVCMDKEIAGLKTISWTDEQLRRASGPMVYIFWSGAWPIYIGVSSHGLTRPLSARHHKAYVKLKADRFQFICCETAGQAWYLEVRLIRLWRPKYNEFYSNYSEGKKGFVSKEIRAILRDIQADTVREACNVKD